MYWKNEMFMWIRYFFINEIKEEKYLNKGYISMLFIWEKNFLVLLFKNYFN